MDPNRVQASYFRQRAPETADVAVIPAFALQHVYRNQQWSPWAMP
ncbi:hypothetical protein MMEU_1372 [Mycobacterium marinum str. Europe]|nr:hypothetical protein MMEU_1372 [Mycobacterium marinum str. Europe]